MTEQIVDDQKFNEIFSIKTLLQQKLLIYERLQHMKLQASGEDCQQQKPVPASEQQTEPQTEKTMVSSKLPSKSYILLFSNGNQTRTLKLKILTYCSLFCSRSRLKTDRNSNIFFSA